MTIEECRAKNCVHVSNVHNHRNCGVVDCSNYEGYFEERWTEEEDHEFEDCVDEDMDNIQTQDNLPKKPNLKYTNEMYLRPEKPFLVIYTVNNEVSYSWFENLDDVYDLIDELNEWHKDKYEITDIVEIGSYRELKLA